MPDIVRIFLLAAAAATLAACGPRSGPPAPVSHGGESRPALSRAEAASGVVVVQPGDTLYAVARRTGAPVRALIDINRLQAPYRIQAGQRLQIPTVAAARPAASTGPAVTTSAPAVAAPAVAAAPRGSVDSAPIAPPPSAQAPSPPIVMPPPPAPGSDAAAAGPPSTSTSSTTSNSPATSLPPAGPPQPPNAPAAPATGASPPPPPASSAAVAPPAPQPVEEAPARAGRFLWPLRGNIVSTFGQKPGGLQNDGINIAAPRGTPVRATENGVVVYAGNELKGFGNLLLLRHADGWMSAYAHLDEIQVARGASVGRGQVVGKVGQTGSVATPQLHFELRRGGRAVDPRGQLAPLQTAGSN